MKVKTQEIMNFAAIPFGDKKLPIRVGYAISVNSVEVEKKLKAYDEQRIKLLEELAEKGSDGKPIIENGSYKVTDMNKFSKELADLREAEIDMSVTTITLDDLAKCDGPGFDPLTVVELSVLNFMIEK